MDVRLLRHFCLVVEHNGFSRAVAHANATQSTLSKAVAQLEEIYGVGLLTRSRDGVRLTDAGDILRRRATAMLREMDLLREELAALSGLERGELRLGLPPMGSDVLFAPLLARFRREHPGVAISLVEQGSSRLQTCLLECEIDVAATLLPVAPLLDCLPVRDEPLLAILSEGHPRAACKSFRLRWLEAEPLILFEDGFALNQLIADACRKLGVTPRKTIGSGHVDFILALASAGAGVALLPRIALQDRPARGVVGLPLSTTSLRWETVLAWRKNDPLPAAARAWLELVRSATHPMRRAELF